MPKSVHDPLQRVLDAMDLNVSVQGRYRRQKVIVLGAWGLLCVATVLWSFSGSRALDNTIGASIQSHVVSTSGERWYAITNSSDFDWTDVRVVLDEHYVFDIEEPLNAGGLAQVSTRDFRYLLYVPRARRLAGAHAISAQDPPAPTAPPSFVPSSLRIETEQGAHTHLFEEDGDSTTGPDAGPQSP